MAQPVLETDDRNKVVGFLSNLDAFKHDSRDRTEFVSGAGLNKPTSGIYWAGDPGTVVGNLVDVLNTHGFLVESPNYHAVGKLLVYCLSYPNVGLEDVTYLASLIVRHGLVHDTSYLLNLKQKYKIAEDPPAESLLIYKPELILIPAGDFKMGANPTDPDANVWEYGCEQKVYLPEFWIGKYPVTNQEYGEFIDKTDNKAPIIWDGKQPDHEKLNHPVAGVSWYDAKAYCDWLNKQTGHHYRLPSEAEWEKASRGDECRIYPWGNEWENNRCHMIKQDIRKKEKTYETTSKDQYKSQSPYGCYDMVGNLREWTSTLWGDRLDPQKSSFPYPWKPDDREKFITTQRYFRAYFVYRGGGVYDSQAQMRCSARDWDVVTATYMCGFRVACD